MSYYDLHVSPGFYANEIRYDYTYTTAIAYNIGTFAGLTP